MPRRAFEDAKSSPEHAAVDPQGETRPTTFPSVKVVGRRVDSPLPVVLGVLQMAVGMYCIVTNIGFHRYLEYTRGYGIWAGLLIIATLVVSIVAACSCPVVVAFSVLDFQLCSLLSSFRGTRTPNGIIIGVIVLAFLEAALAITSSVLCCRALSCCAKEDLQIQQCPFYRQPRVLYRFSYRHYSWPSIQPVWLTVPSEIK